MRDILVHANQITDWSPGLVHAARLAASLKAALTAVHVVPIGILPLPTYDVGALTAQYAALIEQQRREAQAVAPRFEAWASSLGVAHAQWSVAQGDVAAMLAYAGHWHDLLVLTRADGDPWTEPAGLAEIVLDTRLPCLVVPETAAADAAYDTVLAAWNGSVEAIRALHAALPLLQAARRVVVAMGANPPRSAMLPEFQLERWCTRHGIAAEYAPLDLAAEPGPAILEMAQAANAGLLVMGAYGRSRLAERLLGGVTDHMLRHAPMPVLMRH
ncbi:universal stress protein [Vulcaniibacterium gelatinicum]|uniref:universal stress protein n=1 Tax=Vulcaniibacterium gelatinicum TaxID=2598725 RepID=UPI0011C7828F|nr:universal stress protein [Vulcaniibacterium gelatinicum]